MLRMKVIDRREWEMRGMSDVHSKLLKHAWFKTRPQSRFEFLLVFFIQMASRTLLFR